MTLICCVGSGNVCRRSVLAVYICYAWSTWMRVCSCWLILIILFIRFWRSCYASVSMYASEHISIFVFIRHRKPAGIFGIQHWATSVYTSLKYLIHLGYCFIECLNGFITVLYKRRLHISASAGRYCNYYQYFLLFSALEISRKPVSTINKVSSYQFLFGCRISCIINLDEWCECPWTNSVVKSKSSTYSHCFYIIIKVETV